MTDDDILWAVCGAIAGTKCGRAVVSGPWQALGSSRYSIPTVLRMSKQDPREVVVKLQNGAVEVERPEERRGNHEIDPVGGG